MCAPLSSMRGVAVLTLLASVLVASTFEIVDEIVSEAADQTSAVRGLSALISASDSREPVQTLEQPETLTAAREQSVPETLVSKKTCVQRAAVAHRDCVRQSDASSRDQCFSATYLELSSCIDTAHTQTDVAQMALLAGSEEKVQASQDDQCKSNSEAMATGDWVGSHWQPRGCTLKRYDRERATKCLSKQKIGFFGDSLLLNVYKEIVALLKSDTTKEHSSAKFYQPGGDATCSIFTTNETVKLYCCAYNSVFVGAPGWQG